MNILLTSAGRRSYLVGYFRDALEGEGRVIAANSVRCPAFHAADEYVLTPLIYDEEYIPFLLDYCCGKQIDLLVPLFDIDIPVLAASKAGFEDIGTTVVVPSYEIARICNDKWMTFEHLKGWGFKVPKTFISLEQVREALASGAIEYPLMVKPRWGMASIGVHVARDDDELRVISAIVEREVDESYLRFESESTRGRNVLYQEMLDGIEHGLDVMCDLSCSYIATSVKRKSAMRSGETDGALTIDSPELEMLGARLAQACPHPGNMDVDVFICADGAYVLELNARFGGGYPFSHAAGVDLPRALVQWKSGGYVDPSLLKPSPGVYSYKEIEICTVRMPESAGE